MLLPNVDLLDIDSVNMVLSDAILIQLKRKGSLRAIDAFCEQAVDVFGKYRDDMSEEEFTN